MGNIFPLSLPISPLQIRYLEINFSANCQRFLYIYYETFDISNYYFTKSQSLRLYVRCDRGNETVKLDY